MCLGRFHCGGLAAKLTPLDPWRATAIRHLAAVAGLAAYLPDEVAFHQVADTANDLMIIREKNPQHDSPHLRGVGQAHGSISGLTLIS